MSGTSGRGTWPGCRAAATLMAVVSLLVACSTPAPTVAPPAVVFPAGPTPTARAPSGGLFEPRPADVLSVLQCDGPPSLVGGLGTDWGGPAGRPTPDDTLGAFLALAVFDKPARGWVVARGRADWVLYVYPVDGRVRGALLVAIGVGGTPGWSVADYRSCDASEFDPADLPPDLHVWLDVEGIPVPTWRLQDRAGSAHCEWQSATFLTIGQRPNTIDGARTYVRDPMGLFGPGFLGPGFPTREVLASEFAAGIEHPTDAVDTGWHRDGLDIWTVPDDHAVYVTGGPDGTERWPRETEQILCI